MSDTVRPSSSQFDDGELRHTLTVEEVGTALTAAGVPRSQRQIIRYCQTGMLDAVKVPGPTGDQWFVSPASLPKAIGDLKQWEAQRARHATPRPDTAGYVQPQHPLNDNPDTARHGAPEPAMADLENKEKGSSTQFDRVGHSPTPPPASSYVAQLEKRIEEKDDIIGLLKNQLVAKDEQIGEMTERARETNFLIKGLQELVLRLQPGASPPQQGTDA